MNLSIAVAVLFIIVGLSVIGKFFLYTQEKKEIKEKYIQEQESLFKYEVERFVKDITHRLKNTNHTKEKTIQIIIDLSKEMRFPNKGKEPGIFFIRDYDGIQILSVSKPEIMGKDMSHETDPDGINTHQAFMKIINEKGAGFIDYSLYNMITKKVEKKRSYVLGIPEIRWYIGSGFWYKDIEQIIAENQKKLVIELIMYLVLVFSVTIVILVILSYVTKKFNKEIYENIKTISSSFEKAANEDIFIDKNALKYDEFNYLATSFNAMLKTRKELSAELAQKSEQWRLLISQAGDSIYLADFNGNIVDVNEQAIEETGFSREELLMMKVTDLDDQYPTLIKQKVLWDTLENNKPQTIESKHKRKNGSLFAVEIRISKITINKNNYLLGFARNINERLETQNKLRDWAHRYSAIINNSIDGFWVVNADGIILEVNESYLNLTGYKREELVGFQFTKVDAEEDMAIFKSKINLIKSAKEIIFETTHRKKDNTIIHVEIKAIFLGIEAHIHAAFIRDITEKKIIEAERAKSRAYLIRAEEIALIGHWEYSPIKRTINGSVGALNILGLSVNELPIEKAYNLILAEYKEKMIGGMTKMIYSGQAAQMKFKIKRADDGEIRDLFTNAQYDKDQQLMFGVISDITDEVQTRQNLENQNKEYASLNEKYKQQNIELQIAKNNAEESNELKSRFLHNMSHEIRTPMNGILGFAQMLHRPDLSNEKRSYFTRIIQNSANQLLRVIDDILEISRLETKQVKLIKEQVNLNNLLLEQFAIFDIKAKEHNLSLYLKKGLPDEKANINTDESKLMKILSNLIENALKFTKLGYIEFGYQIENQTITLYVKDTGIGINAGKLSTIFERFSQDENELSIRSGGLGLGLSIAKENAELLGGKIWVESELNKGSCFYINIPYEIAQ